MGIESLTAAGIGSLLTGASSAAGGVSALAGGGEQKQGLPLQQLQMPQAPAVMPLPQMSVPAAPQNDLLQALNGGRGF